MHFTAATILSLFGTLTAATPASYTPQIAQIPFNSSVNMGEFATSDLVAIAPKSISCASALYGPQECATAAQAIIPIKQSFLKYRLDSLGAGTALISTMAFESADFAANKNHVPGRPGQGTKAMLMPNWVAAYVRSDPKLAQTTPQGLGPVELLNLVQGEEYTYGAAAWYLTKTFQLPGGCPEDTRKKLRTDGWDGFNYYVQNCLKASAVGTPVDPARVVVWCRAVKQLKPMNMSMPPKCNETLAQ